LRRRLQKKTKVSAERGFGIRVARQNALVGG
jgi:hypothetical protein